MKRTLVIGLICAGLACLAIAQGVQSAEGAKEQDSKKLIALLDVLKGTKCTKDHIINRLENELPKQTDDFWQTVEDDIDTSEVVAAFTASYSKRFTQAEIRKLTKFFESDAGRKYLKEQPQIEKECRAAGEKWVQETIDAISNRARGEE